MARAKCLENFTSTGWEIKRSAGNDTVFLLGTASNELDVWDLFDDVICLVVDEQTMRHRLKTRTTNDFGKADHELADILEWFQRYEANYRSFGATMIDATAPLDEVADQVIQVALRRGKEASR